MRVLVENGVFKCALSPSCESCRFPCASASSPAPGLRSGYIWVIGLPVAIVRGPTMTYNVQYSLYSLIETCHSCGFRECQSTNDHDSALE